MILWCSAVCTLLCVDIANAVDFNRDIRPILSQNCFQCHGPDEAARQAELRLDDPESLATVIRAGRPNQSELLHRITTSDPEQQMPPVDSKLQLSVRQKELIAEWIKDGAKFEMHWAFQPIADPTPPRVVGSRWVQSDIDRFVLARLKQEGLKPTAKADKETLIRRLSLDLTGLPPTVEKINELMSDTAESAIEIYIDELLRSDAYGEHMAVSWLEAARYADTDGYQNDRYRYHHVWRDWVILAFRENMPYDEFVIQQLAGDLMPGATLKKQIATAFCRNHRINSEDGSIPDEWHVENVADRVDTFGTVFLGLTIGCARCHDHKYDPVSQREYYQLFAYFNNVPEWGVGPNNGNSPPFISVPDSWPNLTEEQNKFQVPEEVKLRRARENDNGNGLKRPQAGGQGTLMIMHEMDEPRDTYLLERGQYNLPDKSQPLSPGVPNVLAPNLEIQPANRLELGTWLASPNNPLTSRVAVNRIWQQLFGTGLVKSSENFGTQGAHPTHPLLLDYLASDFMKHGWDIKRLIKSIVVSATYQQSSHVDSQLYKEDPENQLLARGPRVRLSGFALRDQALLASGLLVDNFGGPSVKPYMPPRIWRAISNNTYKQDTGNSLYRRSVYTYWRRTIPPPTMMTFNAASREVCIVRTERTNTPLQALTLMNNTIFVEAARNLAERMLLSSNGAIEHRIELGFRTVLARRATDDELALLTDLYQQMQVRFNKEPERATKLLATGESKHSDRLNDSELAAMTIVASTILNLDEAVVKP